MQMTMDARPPKMANIAKGLAGFVEVTLDSSAPAGSFASAAVSLIDALLLLRGRASMGVVPRTGSFVLLPAAS